MKNLIHLANARTFALLAILSVVLIPFAGMAAPVGVFGLSVIKASAESSMSYAGLNKEVWLAEIMEDFYADDMFISECRDLSAFVTNDIINLAEAGVDPAVLINNTTYPIAISEREDGNIAIEIDTFDTENTAVKNIEAVELAYDKLSSVVSGHKQALRMAIMEKAAHAIAPASNGTFTPKLVTTGEDDGTGRLRMRFADLIRLRKKFNQAEIPAEGRILVLSSEHEEDLELENSTLYNQILGKGIVYGFKIYNLADSRLPRYHKTTGAKIAFGASVTSDHRYATIAFQKNEVCRAKGTEDMFWGKKENDPVYRRDVVGFQQRAIVLPIRNKGVAAIYSGVPA
jgi:hypothetical protein